MNNSALKREFIQALADYSYLLEKGYIPRGFLKLVGDRYKLTSVERTMLYRGVVSAETVASRKSKTIYLQEFRKPIYIDTLNVITTISSYLLGLPVFISMDGFLRDASQKRGELEKNPKIADAVELLMRFLGQQDIPEIHFWLDDTGRATQTILDEIHKNSTTLTKKVKTEILKNVDKALKEASGGVICTSDSVIVDEFKSQVFDLAKHVIISTFSPDFIDLSTINKV